MYYISESVDEQPKTFNYTPDKKKKNFNVTEAMTKLIRIHLKTHLFPVKNELFEDTLLVDKFEAIPHLVM